MSVRPTVAFVCGINDAKIDDPRYEDPGIDLWDKKLPYNRTVFLGQKDLFFEQVYISGNPAGGVILLPVVGYIISEGNEDLSRGLDLTLGWDTKDRVFVAKPDPIPSEWYQNQYAQREGQDVVDSANRENRWYDTITPWYSDLYYRRAIYILHQAGWVGVTRAMLKFMIVVYWS